ncbi:MAG: hypothetical protein ACRC2R_20690 [Xenococcaceae cyanobacterium]
MVPSLWSIYLKIAVIVKTADSKGQLHLYNFQIFYSQSTPSNLGIQITSANLDRDRNSSRINLGGGRTASLDDVETGLRMAISKGYTSASNPVVTRKGLEILLPSPAIACFKD